MSGPNGHPPRPEIPVMTPKERQVWLASHRAEPYYRLLTTTELAIMENQLRRAAVYEVEFRETVKELDAFGYWDGKPDVKTACADAAFDARRYERATTAAIDRIEKTLLYLRQQANNPHVPCQMIDLADEIFRLDETLTFLKAQSEARRMKVEPKAP